MLNPSVIILTAVISLLISVIAALEFRNIAEMKGHTDGKYFIWCFLFGPAGWAMVIALPDRNSAQTVLNRPQAETDPAPVEELPEL